MKRKHTLPARAAATPAVTTYKALERIRMSWPIHFMRAFAEAIAEAEAAWSSAVLGHPPVTDEDFSLLARERTSLPVMWASFFRDLGDGRTGTDRALEWPPLRAAVLRAGLQRIAQARGVYVECRARWCAAPRARRSSRGGSSWPRRRVGRHRTVGICTWTWIRCVKSWGCAR